jgi:hypothetical protein
MDKFPQQITALLERGNKSVLPILFKQSHCIHVLRNIAMFIVENDRAFMADC